MIKAPGFPVDQIVVPKWGRPHTLNGGFECEETVIRCWLGGDRGPWRTAPGFFYASRCRRPWPTKGKPGPNGSAVMSGGQGRLL
jgi:hypothetical protein